MKFPQVFAIILLILLVASWKVVLSQETLTASCPAISTLSELQDQAERKANDWQIESINYSIDTFIKTANCWKRNNLPENAAANLRQAANLQLILGKNQEAFKIYSEALTIVSSLQNSRERIKILSELTLLSINSGDSASAKRYLNKALRLSDKTEDYSAKAASAYGEAELYYYKRKLENSITAFNKALLMARKASDKNMEARISLYLGYSYLYQDKVQTGYETLLNALKIYEETGDKRGFIFAQIAIGNALAFMDKTQQALFTYKTADSNFSNDVDFIEKARLNNGIAAIYEKYEDWTKAINYRKQALLFFRKAGHKYGELATLCGIGKLFVSNQDYSLALESFAESQRLASSLNDKFYLALIEKELGVIHFRSGENKKSFLHYQNSLNSFAAIREKKQVGLIYDQIGEFHAVEKDFANSYSAFQKALEIHQQVKNSFAMSQTYYNLAKIHNLAGKEEESLQSITKSVELTETLYSEMLNAKLRSTYFSSIFDRYELYINLLMKKQKQLPSENYLLQALQASEKSRARAMLETLSLSEADFTKDADPETVRREKEIRISLNSKSDKLIDLYNTNANKTEITKISNEIDALEDELEQIKAYFNQNSPIYSAIKNPAPFDAAEFQRNVLDENSLLLEFSFGKEESYLWLIGKSELRAYVLPPRWQIERRIEDLRELLKAKELKSGESVEDFQKRNQNAELEYREQSKELSQMLFGQIADKLSNKRLIIVPDGKLHLFPVAALPSPVSGSDEPILLTSEIIYAPSAQTLSIIAKNQKAVSTTTKNLLIFSDPVFTSDDVRFSPENRPVETSGEEIGQTAKFRFAESLNNLARLPASKIESETIIQTVGAATTENYTGFAATRENLLNLKTGDYKIIHFATHGLVKEKHPELSGIMFSRFDAEGQKLDHSVRIQDIYGLNLNADLVVLSACETGIGKEIRGEGLVSLNNAFLQTGAKSVVATLWKVEDGATLELMRNFYDLMVNEKLPPSKALQKSQIKLRENPQYRSPFYWAAFTVQGDFKNTPNLIKQNSYSSYWLLILPAVFGLYAVLRFIRRRKHI